MTDERHCPSSAADAGQRLSTVTVPALLTAHDISAAPEDGSPSDGFRPGSMRLGTYPGQSAPAPILFAGTKGRGESLNERLAFSR